MEAWLILMGHEYAIPLYKKLPKGVEWFARINNSDTITFYIDVRKKMLEIELHLDGSFEWFFANRITHEYDGSGDHAETEFSRALFAKLKEMGAV